MSALIRKKISQLRHAAVAVMSLVTFFYVIFVWSYASLFDSRVLSLSALSAVARLIRVLLLTIVVISIAGALLGLGYGPEATLAVLKMLESILPVKSEDLDAVLRLGETLPALLFQALPGLVTVLFCVTLLLALGGVVACRYEYTLSSLVLSVFSLLVAYAIDALSVSMPEVRGAGELPSLVSSPLLRFLVVMFIFAEAVKFSGHIPNLLRPAEVRLKRIAREIELVERGVQREVRRPPERGLLSYLTRLGRTFLEDSLAIYAQAGEGTARFVSAKLKAHMREMLRKRPDLLESLLGRAELPSAGSLVIQLVRSILMKTVVALAIAFIALWTPALYTALGIIELTSVEFSVLVAIVLALLVYFLVELVLR